MATIRPNDIAPSEEVKYILSTDTFDLAAGGSVESTDRKILTDAEAHPWLKVEYPETEKFDFQRPSHSVPYEDDALAALNSVAFDPEEIRKTEQAKVDAFTGGHPLAVDAGLDQGDEETAGDISVTLAAEENAPSWTGTTTQED